MNSKQKGNIAEDKACKYLINKNYEILERNFYFKGGEIDIIAKKDNTIHFIEVKSGENFNAIYNITPSKLKRIIKGAFIYLNQKHLDISFCIDAVIVKKDKIEHIKNITLI